MILNKLKKKQIEQSGQKNKNLQWNPKQLEQFPTKAEIIQSERRYKRLSWVTGVFCLTAWSIGRRLEAWPTWPPDELHCQCLGYRLTVRLSVCDSFWVSHLRFASPVVLTCSGQVVRLVWWPGCASWWRRRVDGIGLKLYRRLGLSLRFLGLGITYFVGLVLF